MNNLFLICSDWLNNHISAIQQGLMPQALKPESRAGDNRPTMQPGGIAVIDIIGPLSKDGGGWFFGGTSTVNVQNQIRAIRDDSSVKSVLLNIDSPGGTVAGTQATADAVRELAAVKPVHAHIEDLGASAAYWIASQANTISANPTALVGSIGTMLVVHDMSALAEREGVKVHVISTGDYKGALTPGAPVTDEHLEDLQEMVDALNVHFTGGVKAGRKLNASQLKAVTDGRVHIASKAKDLNLIDRVGSFEQAIKSLSAGRLGKTPRMDAAMGRLRQNRIESLSGADAR